LFRLLRPHLAQQRELDRELLEIAAEAHEGHERLAEEQQAQARRIEELTDQLREARDALAVGCSLAEPGVEHPLLQTPLHPQAKGRPTKVLCSLAVGPHLQLLAAARPTFEAYCARHGYDLVLVTEPLVEGRPPSWQKIELVRRLLERHDLVLWVDSDMCFVDVSVDVADELPADKDLAIRVAWEDGRQHGMNAGFWLLRSTPWAAQFLDDVWGATQFIDHPWWENAAFLHVFGYDVPVGAWAELSVPYKQRSTPHDDHLHSLGYEWNISRIDPEPPNPRLRHFFRLEEADASEDRRRAELLGGLLELRRRLAG
jgi:hypothetical protein